MGNPKRQVQINRELKAQQGLPVQAKKMPRIQRKKRRAKKKRRRR